MINFEQITKELQTEFPDFKLVKKHESKFMWILYYVLLMFLWCPDYMKTYTTVFRKTVYMPEQFIGTDSGADILRHERVHMRDSDGWKVLYYAPSYVLLPIGPSGRAYWELRAYKESMRAYFERWNTIPDSSIEFWASQFTSSKYLWMWPFPAHIHKILNNYKTEIIQSKPRA